MKAAPLSYNDACRRYADWAEKKTAEQGYVPTDAPIPNRQLSKLVGTTWHLYNVRGFLARVSAKGRVWRPRATCE
jgi:hypothetical protein